MNEYAIRTCPGCGIKKPANQLHRYNKKNWCAKCLEQDGVAVIKREQTSSTSEELAAKDESRGCLMTLFMLPFQIILWIGGYILLAILWVLKKLSIKVFDQDGDGNLDSEDARILLKKFADNGRGVFKRFTKAGKADAAERKLQRMKNKKEEKEKKSEKEKADEERLSIAKKEIEELKD